MKKFHTTKERTVTDIIPYTVKQLETLMLVEKPKLIFNAAYSERIPFIVITEYKADGFLSFCTGGADKTPKHTTFERLWDELRYQGLDQCYIEEDKEFEASILDQAPDFPPSRCPITGRSFFMYIKDSDGTYVPTYGGPRDSYTIPVKVDDEDDPYAYCCDHFDHDEGFWSESESLSMAPEIESKD